MNSFQQMEDMAWSYAITWTSKQQSNRQAGKQAGRKIKSHGGRLYLLLGVMMLWVVHGQTSSGKARDQESKQTSKVRLLMFSHNQILWAQVEKMNNSLVVPMITLNGSISLTRGARAKKWDFWAASEVGFQMRYFSLKKDGWLVLNFQLLTSQNAKIRAIFRVTYNDVIE